MDKTTTWLIRGASLIVIILGINYLAQPYIQRYKEYQSLSEYEKALLRCENFPEISYSDLVEKVKNNQIKEFFRDFNSEIFQVITTKGKKYILQKDDYNDKEVWELLEKIPFKDEDKFAEGGKYYDNDITFTGSYYTSMICK